MITRTTALIAAATLAVGLSACGGGDDSAGGDASSPLAEAIAADMMEESEGSPVATQEEANCWANKIVSDIGEDRLEELGVTVDNVGDIEDLDLTDEEMNTLIDGMFGCVDVKAMFAEQFEEDFGAEGAQCLADALDEDFVREAMVAEQEGTEPSADFMQAFLDIAAECDLPIN